MYKLALVELWWKEHYGNTDIEEIKTHYIVDSYVKIDDLYKDFENVINRLRYNALKKRIYRTRKLKLEIVSSFKLQDYEICILKTFWLNVFLRKCKKYLLKRKNINIFYTNKLDKVNFLIRNKIISFY